MSQPRLLGNLGDLLFLTLLESNFDDAMGHVIWMRESLDWDL
jgi:hypothetical protein